MERRDTAGSALETPKPESSRQETKAWQAIRRTLGRLVSHVGVRRVDDSERTITVPARQADLAWTAPQVSEGASWKPTAALYLAPVPEAGTGLRESDLLPTVSVARGDAALTVPGLRAMPIPGLETLRVETAPPLGPVGVTRLPESFMRLPVSPVRVGNAVLPSVPKIMPLRTWQLALPPVALLRLPRMAEPRVRWGGDSVLRRMPLTRRGQEAGTSGALGDPFAAERRRLAETVRLPVEEITLLGVYPDVPIMAVERISVEEEGRQLRLWLKPEVLRGRTGSHRITLLVGRQDATGKMLQAAL